LTTRSPLSAKVKGSLSRTCSCTVPEIQTPPPAPRVAPRRDVDAVATDVVTFDDDVTETIAKAREVGRQVVGVDRWRGLRRAEARPKDARLWVGSSERMSTTRTNRLRRQGAHIAGREPHQRAFQCRSVGCGPETTRHSGRPLSGSPATPVATGRTRSPGLIFWIKRATSQKQAAHSSTS
jgi:hypothetical protein